jgi:hypothetical protein
MKMKLTLNFLLLLALVGLIGCSTAEVDDLNLTQVPVFVEPTSIPSATPTLVAIQTPTEELEMPTTTPNTSTPTSVALTPLATNVVSTNLPVSTSIEPILVATVPPDPYRQSAMPENVWWSKDSQTLFYQNIETQQAWAYEIANGSSSSIPYVPRSFRELAPQIQSFLPSGAYLFSISPLNNYILYAIPLSEPIPLDPPRFENSMNPAYTSELWLRQGSQDFNLGLVDDCFGLLSPPIWSANENRAVVNTYGTPDVTRACMYNSWLIDIEEKSVNSLPVPWEDVRSYSVRDLSDDGQLLLVRVDVNYLYNLETKEELLIPDADTDRAILVQAGDTPTCLILELEFSMSESVSQEHIWYSIPDSGSSTLLATINGRISQWVISPDKRFIAFVVDNINEFTGEPYADTAPGIWLLALP